MGRYAANWKINLIMFNMSLPLCTSQLNKQKKKWKKFL